MTKPPDIEVALKLTGQGFDPEDVTKVVGLQPTKTWRLGDPVQRTALRRKNDGWSIGVAPTETFDMETVLCRLLDIIEPHKEKIIESMSRFNLQGEISFGVFVYGETPASYFEADTVRRVAALGASLGIDLILSE